jgi:hypothetical protein
LDNIDDNALINQLLAPLEAEHEIDATAKTLSFVNPAVCQFLAELSGQSGGKINRIHIFMLIFFRMKSRFDQIIF